MTFGVKFKASMLPIHYIILKSHKRLINMNISFFFSLFWFHTEFEFNRLWRFHSSSFKLKWTGAQPFRLICSQSARIHQLFRARAYHPQWPASSVLVTPVCCALSTLIPFLVPTSSNKFGTKCIFCHILTFWMRSSSFEKKNLNGDWAMFTFFGRHPNDQQWSLERDDLPGRLLSESLFVSDIALFNYDSVIVFTCITSNLKT